MRSLSLSSPIRSPLTLASPILGAVLLATILLFVVTSPALAADPDPTADLLAQLGELRKAEDVSGLITAVAEVPPLYKAATSTSVQSKLRGALGKIAKDDDLGEARGAALEALVALEDPKAAWKEVSKLLPTHKVKEATDFDLLVLDIAGQLAPTRAIKSLLDLAAKAKDANLAKAAVLALGGYHADKKNRVSIFEELMDVGKRTRPGQSTEKATSTEAYDRWSAVGPAINKTMNRLTGQKCASFEDWEDLWREFKKRPKELFED